METRRLDLAGMSIETAPPIRLDKKIRNRHLTARLAVDEVSRTAAFRIRHEAYLRSGHIDDRPDAIFSDQYDHQSNMATAIISYDGMAAGTVRVGAWRPHQREALPAMEIFHTEVEALTAEVPQGMKAPAVVEVGRIARASAYENDTTIIHGVFRTAGYLIRHFDPEIVFCAVRLHHQPIYRHFGFDLVGQPRQYPGLRCAMALMAYFRSGFNDALDSLPFLDGLDEDHDQMRRLVAGDFIDIAPPTSTLRRQSRLPFDGGTPGLFNALG